MNLIVSSLLITAAGGWHPRVNPPKLDEHTVNLPEPNTSACIQRLNQLGRISRMQMSMLVRLVKQVHLTLGADGGRVDHQRPDDR